ncbi:multidrug ABC transporter ATP-binding protein [Zhengella mangrovi]|uniref:Multidrug ABC transporter ATP-binding protein n=1 Tax=Zhengella mangrovi TaxID=1982044 RepID=A0A2G1QP81_9HYPH|nr:ABC transporter ATP-binding protein [Zhengella mangrovi]PHP67357.1 multidrug ABC transporter ATP-binding protein [Zhengella mangrovi]
MSEAREKPDGGFWHSAENRIDAFADTDRAVLPKQALAFIGHFARQAKGPFVLLLIVGGIMGGVDAGLYWSVGWLIDLMEKGDPATFLATHWPALAALLALVLVGRAAAMIASSVLEQQVIVPQFYAMVRWQAFRRVIEQPFAFYQNDFAGRIATKIMQGGDAVGDFLIGILQTMWMFLTFVVLTFSILFTLDPWMAGVIAAWLCVYGLVAHRLLPPLRRHAKQAADARSVFNGRMVDAFTNILAVKLFDSGRREHAFVRDGLEMQLDATRQLTRSITRLRMAVALVNGVMISAIGAIAVSAWMAGTATTGAIATAMGLVFRLNQMSGWVMFNINGLIRNFATVQDTTSVVSVDPAITDRPQARTMVRAKGHIRFEDVTFHYGKGKGVIDGLTLDIRPGEKVALVGPSGAGKTTVVHLLLRLFDVEGGRITLDGTDIRDLTQASLRAQFGVVAQEPMLMHRSIRDNIAYGRPGATQDEIEAAARRAAAHEFIQSVGDLKGRKGYDAHVGERGVKLSGGQRQRIAIARMMLKDAPVLILDEATSALDSEIEAAIQDKLADMMEGRTVIAIAHRLSTIAAMDRLIVVDKGAIVETGTHDELVDAGGLYSRLWARQSGGFLSDGIQRNAAAE